MKLIQFFLCVCILVLISGCKKTPDYQYAVSCLLPSSFGEDRRILLVTDIYGNWIDSIPMDPNVTEVFQTFSYSAERPVEVFNLHLLMIDPGGCANRIFSHLHIRKGEKVAFWPETTPVNASFPEEHTGMVLIEGVESLDSSLLNGLYSYTMPSYDPIEKRMYFWYNKSISESALFQFWANGEASFRYVYLPDSMARDTMVFQWAALKSESDGSIIRVSLPEQSFKSDASLTVYLVSPDFRHFSQLSGRRGTIEDIVSFFLPAEVDLKTSLIGLEAINREKEDRIFVTGKVVQPGAPLKIDAPGIRIEDAAALDASHLVVDTRGDADWVRVNAALKTSKDCEIKWRIDSRPEALQDLPLPDLRAFFPWLNNYPQLFDDFTVTAYQFNKFSHEQIREGFPFRPEGAFSWIRDGYQLTQKKY